MKKLVILAIAFFAAVISFPTVIIGGPAGPPEGLDVNVVNPLPLPISIIDENVRIPYQGEMTAVKDGDQPSAQTDLDPEPPEEKILTIEYISGECVLTTDSNYLIPRVRTKLQNVIETHPLFLRQIDTPSGGAYFYNYIVNQKTLIFTETGPSHSILPHIEYSWTGLNPGYDCTFHVSGFLQDLPQ